MKLSSIPVILAAAAGLASAAPIRVVVISTVPRVSTPEPMPKWAQSIRWGHAAVPAFNSLPPLIKPANPGFEKHLDFGTVTPIEPVGMRNGMMRKGGCRGGMRAKSMELGNKLRVILGLPPIEYIHRPHHGEIHGGVVQAIPHTKLVEAIPHTKPVYHHGMREFTQLPPLHVRLSYALASLGPWEGRAVSFVLGCGLGVILRMFFVFGVLIVRSLRARGQERRVALEEDTVIFVADVKEQPVVEALPAYVEKPAVAPEGNNVAH